MTKITIEQALILHNMLTALTGGDPSLREMPLLESALESAYATFGGVELYPSVEEKAARLGHSLIANHAFVDGNKRIGMLVMMTFLEVNGAGIRPTVDEVARVGIATASGEMRYSELLSWIRDNK